MHRTARLTVLLSCVVPVACGGGAADTGGPAGAADAGSPPADDAGQQGSVPDGATLDANPQDAGSIPCSVVTQPQVVFDVDAVFAIIVDGTDVFAMSANEIATGPAGGGPVRSLVGTAQPMIDGFAVDASSVYWTQLNGEIHAVARSGGAPRTVATGLHQPRDLVADGSNLYVSTWDSVVRVSLLDGSVVNLATGLDDPTDIVLDESTVYWLDAANGNGTVNALPRGGGFIRVLANGQDFPRGIAINATNIYWTERGGGASSGTVRTVSLDGGVVTALASGQAGPDSVAIDDSNVYWSNEEDGSVMKVPLAGGAPTAIACGQTAPESVAVDAAYVYWADNNDGKVFRAPK